MVVSRPAVSSSVTSTMGPVAPIQNLGLERTGQPPFLPCTGLPNYAQSSVQKHMPSSRKLETFKIATEQSPLEEPAHLLPEQLQESQKNQAEAQDCVKKPHLRTRQRHDLTKG